MSDAKPHLVGARGGTVRVRDVVADGLYVAAAATRLQLKNRILVAALAGDEAFEIDRWLPEAREIVRELANEADAEADRVRHEMRGLWHKFDESSGTHEYRSRDARNLRRRRKQSRHIARALREKANDDATMRAVVTAARDAAWEEVAANIDRSLRAEAARPDLEADYEQMRRARMQALRLVDLPQLGAQQRARARAARAPQAPDSTEPPPVG